MEGSKAMKVAVSDGVGGCGESRVDWSKLEAAQYSSQYFIPIVEGRKAEEQICYDQQEAIKTLLDRPVSPLDRLLLDGWAAASSTKGVLNYTTDDVLTKLLPGKHNIIAQLSPNRAKSRRKPSSFTQVKEPFSNDTFNFSKIKQKELLLNVTIKQEQNDEPLEGSVIVNVAPICATHCLLLPFSSSCSSQLLDQRGLELATGMVFLSASRSFRVGFNSLCAMASVNHYHFHCYYLQHHITLETAELRRVAGPCHVLADYYAPGFMFLIRAETLRQDIRNAMKLVEYLIKANIPHNLFITRGTSVSVAATADYDVIRLCIWARESITGMKDIYKFSTALCELGGHIPVYDEKDYHALTEEAVYDVCNGACKASYEAVLSKITTIFCSAANPP